MLSRPAVSSSPCSKSGLVFVSSTSGGYMSTTNSKAPQTNKELSCRHTILKIFIVLPFLKCLWCKKSTQARSLDTRSHLPYVSLCCGAALQEPDRRILRHTLHTTRRSSFCRYQGDSWATFSQLESLYFSSFKVFCFHAKVYHNTLRITLAGTGIRRLSKNATYEIYSQLRILHYSNKLWSLEAARPPRFSLFCCFWLRYRVCDESKQIFTESKSWISKLYKLCAYVLDQNVPTL